MIKHLYLTKSFVIQIGDLLFSIKPNNLNVGKIIDGVYHNLTTEIRSEDLELLYTLADKGKSIVAPIHDYKVIFNSSEGLQDVFLFKDSNNDHALVINNQIQFTTNCERSYHEALVSPAIGCLDNNPSSILILGGGDGLAAKQIFREHPNCKVTLVDFDKFITDLFIKEKSLSDLNENSLQKCNIINKDAFEFVQSCNEKYDIVICDFPDPDQEIFNKLYSVEFYSMIKKLLKPEGIISIQSGPLAYNSNCFLCIKKTVESIGINTLTYYSATPHGPSIFTIGKIEETPVVKLKNTYDTINQEFFNNAMCAPIPNFEKKYDSVEINTLDNYMAYTYKMIELKLLKLDTF